MADIIVWLKANWESVLAIIGGLVSVATVITALTPTPKDDGVLLTIKKFLSIFGLLNYDKSFIGSSEIEKKKD